MPPTIKEIVTSPSWSSIQDDPEKVAAAKDRLFQQHTQETPERQQYYDSLDPQQQEELKGEFETRLFTKYPDQFKALVETEAKQGEKIPEKEPKGWLARADEFLDTHGLRPTQLAYKAFDIPRQLEEFFTDTRQFQRQTLRDATPEKMREAAEWAQKQSPMRKWDWWMQNNTAAGKLFRQSMHLYHKFTGPEGSTPEELSAIANQYGELMADEKWMNFFTRDMAGLVAVDLPSIWAVRYATGAPLAGVLLFNAYASQEMDRAIGTRKQLDPVSLTQAMVTAGVLEGAKVPKMLLGREGSSMVRLGKAVGEKLVKGAQFEATRPLFGQDITAESAVQTALTFTLLDIGNLARAGNAGVIQSRLQKGGMSPEGAKYFANQVAYKKDPMATMMHLMKNKKELLDFASKYKEAFAPSEANARKAKAGKGKNEKDPIDVEFTEKTAGGPSGKRQGAALESATESKAVTTTRKGPPATIDQRLKPQLDRLSKLKGDIDLVERGLTLRRQQVQNTERLLENGPYGKIDGVEHKDPGNFQKALNGAVLNAVRRVNENPPTLQDGEYKMLGPLVEIFDGVKVKSEIVFGQDELTGEPDYGSAQFAYQFRLEGNQFEGRISDGTDLHRSLSDHVPPIQKELKESEHGLVQAKLARDESEKALGILGVDRPPAKGSEEDAGIAAAAAEAAAEAAPWVPDAGSPEVSFAALVKGPIDDNLNGPANLTSKVTGKTGQPPEPTSIYPEVERRWKEAKAQPDNRVNKLVESVKKWGQSFGSAYPSLNKNEDGAVMDMLRQYKSVPDYAQAIAIHTIRGFTAGFGPKKYDLFSRAVILPDHLKDVENGLYAGKEDPWGYEGAHQVQADLDRINQFVKANPDVEEAIDRRNTFLDTLRFEAVNLGLLSGEVLNDPRYFHHQVLQYANMKREVSGDRRLKEGVRGFQKSRKGSALPYNTEYIESEFELITQMISQIETVKMLRQIGKSDYNVMPTLAKAAKVMNLETFRQMAEKEKTSDAALLKPFARQMNLAANTLGAMADAGTLISDSHQPTVNALAEAYRNHEQSKKDFPNDPDKWVPVQVDDPGFLDFLGELRSKNNTDPGKAEASQYMRAVEGRRKFIDDFLGDKKVKWQDLVPEGYTVWQPKPGNHMYYAYTIPERALNQILESEAVIRAEDLKKIKAQGGPKEQWVIPTKLATALNQLRPPENSVPEQIAKEINTAWKQWTLSNPFRVIRYRLNNMTGDLDKVLAADPGIFLRESWGAFRDLTAYYRKKQPPTPELLDAFKRGVIGSGFSTQETPDLKKHEFFKVISGETPNFIDRYWQKARNFGEWSEGILRLAAYRRFKKRLERGDLFFAASNPRKVKQVIDQRGTDAAAAMMARELVGDYGNISVGGQWMREKMAPFYSWWEVNLPGYYRMFANLKEEAQAGGNKNFMGWRIAAGGTALALRAFILYSAINLWNMADEKRREASKTVNKSRDGQHLVIGNKDGTITTIRMQGAMTDALGWFGLEEAPQDLEALVTGKRTVGEQAHKMLTAPINRIVNGMMPIEKGLAESLLGFKLYPDVTEPRMVRDRVEHIAGTFSLDKVYRLLADRPTRSHWDDLRGLVSYTMDAGQANYMASRELVREFVEKQGDDAPLMGATKRGNYLFYHKMALKYGDERRADKYLKKYFEEDGTPKNMVQSMKSGHPLLTLPSKYRKEFLSSLSPEDKQVFDAGAKWYTDIYMNPEYFSQNGEKIRRIYESVMDAKSKKNAGSK